MTSNFKDSFASSVQEFKTGPAVVQFPVKFYDVTRVVSPFPFPLVLNAQSIARDHIRAVLL